MIILNPLTSSQHKFWRDRIKSDLISNEYLLDQEDFLSLKEYLINSPQKYYSKEAFALYFEFLNDIFIHEPNVLKMLFDEKLSDISVSNRVLNEVNNLERNDELVSKNDNEVIDLIQNKIIYNYLRILEAPFYTLLYLVAKKSRLDRKASTDGLDVYNAIQELNNSKFNSILNVYDGVLRNSIAHGKFSISSLSNLITFTFFDKKGKTSEYAAKKLINLYDNLLDITNGFYLAYKLFCLTKTDELSNLRIKVANSIYIDEIISSANGPSWEVVNIYEVNRNNKKYLSIYVKSSFVSQHSDKLQAINTSVISSKFFKDCQITYIDIKSKWASVSAFHINANKLRNAIENEWLYVEPDLIELEFWLPKFKLLKYASKLQVLSLAFMQEFNLFKMKKMLPIVQPEILINNFDSRKNHCIINARCIIAVEDKVILQEYIQMNYKSIIEIARKDAMKKSSFFLGKSFLPIIFIRVYIYSRVKRKRQIDFSSIDSGLFSVIEWDEKMLVQPIEIFNKNKFEESGKYRITWDEEQIVTAVTQKSPKS